MLVRWQGADAVDTIINPTGFGAYNLGTFTGVNPYYNSILNAIAPLVQRGRPINPAGSPTAQLRCYDVGILINSWETPHRPVVGGGYNNMWGYSWSAGNRISPFVKDGVPTDLVLQANIAVPTYGPRIPSNDPDFNHTAGTGQVGMYAYLKDTTPGHENLPPIAVLAMTHLSGYEPAFNTDGYFAFDYSDADTSFARTNYPAWFAQNQAGSEVWFASDPINTGSSQPYVTTGYTQGNLNSTLAPVYDPNVAMPFWRGHITLANLLNIVNRINTNSCGGPPNCPPKVPSSNGCGYSVNPAAYVLEYAGIIAETTIAGDHIRKVGVNKYDQSPSNWTINDALKNQVAIAVKANGFGVYRYIP